MPQRLLPAVELTKPWGCCLPRLTAAQTWGSSACAELSGGSSEVPEALQAPITPGSDPKGWIPPPSSGAYGTEKLSAVLSPEQKQLLSERWSVPSFLGKRRKGKKAGGGLWLRLPEPLRGSQGGTPAGTRGRCRHHHGICVPLSGKVEDMVGAEKRKKQ